ncbi:MAG: hypothetical protein QI223_00360 [Candidatus Korarchaeota archaeon]|nr:hypothetical protein [Candidatus Korarchaeota archaeon]
MEGPLGRVEYASMGGRYFAARLAVTEARERGQARVLVLGEIHRDQLTPLRGLACEGGLEVHPAREAPRGSTASRRQVGTSTSRLRFWVWVSETLGGM